MRSNGAAYEQRVYSSGARRFGCVPSGEDCAAYKRSTAIVNRCTLYGSEAGATGVLFLLFFFKRARCLQRVLQTATSGLVQTFAAWSFPANRPVIIDANEEGGFVTRVDCDVCWSGPAVRWFLSKEGEVDFLGVIYII